jgi:riboflavin kinase / FMN adenylyltransferase
MLTFRDIRQAQIDGPTAITIGNFDGLHLGHQMLLDQTKRIAREWEADAQAGDATKTGRQMRTALLTFDPHPLSVFRPQEPLLLMTSARERLMLAAEHGIDVGVAHPFTRATADMEAHEFIALLKQHLGLAALVVGPDFALGRNRSGNIARLRELGQQVDFDVHVLEPFLLGDVPVRSSIVRDLLLAGDVSEAARLLGRPYRVAGAVQAGDQRGRQVGIPTANVAAPPDKLLPADGVYATRTIVPTFDGTRVYDSATNIGMRPTVNGTERRVETHLLHFPSPDQIDDLYGQTLAVEFLGRLRGEQRFASLADLVRQIHLDIEQAQHWFAQYKQ